MEEASVLLAKPLAAGAVSLALDKLLFKFDTKSSVAFAASVAGGLLVADLASKHMGVGDRIARGLETRVLEVGLASGAALALDRYVFDYARYDVPTRIGMVFACEVVGEYIADTFQGVV